MQRLPGGEFPPGLDAYEQMVNTFAKNAKDFWRQWGPLGDPMVQSIDAWAAIQLQYVQWLRQAYGGGQR